MKPKFDFPMFYKLNKSYINYLIICPIGFSQTKLLVLLIKFIIQIPLYTFYCLEPKNSYLLHSLKSFHEKRREDMEFFFVCFLMILYLCFNVCEFVSNGKEKDHRWAKCQFLY